MPEADEPIHHPNGRELTDDEKHLAKLGYRQELSRSWSGFSNFAISFSIISILAGCFTTFGQAWSNGGPIAISWGWPFISAFILLIGFTMSELVSAYPTSGGIYWWAAKLGGPRAGFFTGWLNLDRPGRRHRLGRLRRGQLRGHLHQHHQRQLGGQLQPPARLHRVRGHPGARRARQHLLQPPARRDQQRLGVVARRRRRADRADPDRGARPPPEHRLGLQRADQQLRATTAVPPTASCSGSSCCRSASC